MSRFRCSVNSLITLLISVTAANAVPAGREAVREFVVSVYRNGAWEEAGRLPCGTDFADMALPVDAGAAGTARVRIAHAGTTMAHVDMALLGGACPAAVDGCVEPSDLALAKLGRTDHDVIDISSRTVDFSYAGVAGACTLKVNGRIEPAEISPVPFQFPEANCYTVINPKSAFYAYRLGSCPGRLTADGDLDSEDLCDPLFKVYCKPGSGHPDAYTWGWVRDDGESLYVAVDFASDNTMDGDKDYAKVYVNRWDSVQCFTASVPEQAWGRPGFTYTAQAAYQHKVYEFAIPLARVTAYASRPGAVVELAFGAYGTSAMEKVMFVHPDGDDANNGRSWNAAKRTLRGALAAALYNDEIWVAEGTYYPDGGTGDRDASFTFPENYIGVYGGFGGSEIYREQRSITAHPCTLSGDIGVPGDPSDNSRHVVAAGDMWGLVLDGFTVTGGNADGSAYPDDAGGGLLLDGEGSFSAYHCVFTGNRAGLGGAVYAHSDEGSFLFSDVVFDGNAADATGGAVHAYDADITIVSSVLAGNAARTGGAVYAAGSQTVRMDRATLYGNTAVDGGAVAGTGAALQIESCVLWGNRAANAGAAGYFTVGAPVVGFSCVEGGVVKGGFAGDAPVDNGGNISAYPAFADTAGRYGPDGLPFTADDGLMLREGSPCILAGYEGGNMGAYQGYVDSLPATLSARALDDSTVALAWSAGAPGTGVDSIGIWFIAGRLPVYAFDGSTAVLGTSADTAAVMTGLVPGRTYGFRLFRYDLRQGWSVDTAACPGATVRMPYMPRVIRVDSAAAGPGDGTSWNTAFNTLYGALDAANDGDTLWVAGGTYYPVPDSATVRDSVLWVKPGVALLGGFAGTETRTGQRDPAANMTVLSGDIGVRGDPSDNSYTVVMCGSGAVVDGFTVRDGYNDNGWLIDDMMKKTAYRGIGGGLCAVDAESLRIAACTFTGNYAEGSGGALYLYAADAVVEGCRFIGNTANGGGAAYCAECSPVFSGCVFSGNTASGAGSGLFFDYRAKPLVEGCVIGGGNGPSAVYAYYNASPVLTGCVIAGSAGDGFVAEQYCFPTFENCVLAGNAGSALYMYESSVLFTGGTVFRNDAVSGGGLYLDEYWGIASRFTNTLFWGNRAAESGAELYIYMGYPRFSHCTVEGGIFGGKVDFMESLLEDAGHNGAADPQFPDSAVGTWNADAAYDAVRGVSYAVMTGAGWTANEHAGRFLWADTSGTMRLFPVTGNTADTLTVLGDLRTLALNGAGFTVYDLRLTDGSPAVNAGDGDVVTTATDAAGEVRVQRGAVDLGAYESAWYADRTPPDVSGLELSAAPLDTGAVVLSWNPDDIPDGDVDTVVIRYAADAYPLSPDSGTAAGAYLPGTAADTVTGLNPYSVYYFSMFVRDTSGNWSDTAFALMKRAVTPPAYDTLYVDASAAGAGTGDSWTDAFTDLQAALAAADSFTAVWVAAGTYLPDTGTDRSASFVLKPHVYLYGGFAGNESTLDERDWTVNRTILSGDLGAPVDSSDNAYHVVTGADSAVLDGFVICHGLADVDGDDAGCGGGLICVSSSPHVYNCTFMHNHAITGSGIYARHGAPVIDSCVITGNWYEYGGSTDGGGIYCDSSSAVITGCVITANACNGGWSGGGICISGPSQPLVSGCVITGNTAWGTNGGGVAVEDGADVRFVNCVISGNMTDNGGGAYVYGARAEFNGCVFAGNGSEWAYGGGLLASMATYVGLVNCTFAGNAGYDGGALHLSDTPSDMVNCVFWGNRALMGSGEAYNMNGSVSGSYCTMEGGFGGSKCVGTALTDVAGNSGNDPQFAAADTGIWTDGAVYDTVAGVTVIVRPGAGWVPDALAGMFLNPDTTGIYQFYIIGNTADSVTVVGNVLGYADSAGVPYRITDYRLPDGSPAADAGTPDTAGLGVPAYDFAGTPRIENGRIDMGAYERVNRRPSVTSAPADTATEDEPFRYGPAATDPETYPVVTVAGLPGWLAQDGDSLRGTPREGDGDTTFTIYADDGYGGRDTLRVLLAVTAVNDPPVVASAAVETATEDVPYRYAGYGTDPDDAVLAVTYTGIPAWTAVSGDTLYGTPGEGVVSASFTVIVTDPAGLADSQEVTVTVVPVNDRPRIVSNAVDIAAEDIEYSYIAAAYDPDGTPVVSFAAYPSYLSVSGDTLHGTPREGDGDTSFMVIADDGLLADTLRVALRVIAVNDVPAVTSPAADTAVQFQPYSYAAVAVDPDGDPSVSFVGVPGWLTPDAGGTLSGTPGAAAVDTFFLVVASDGLLAGTLAVALHIVPAPLVTTDTVPPVINVSASFSDGETLAVSAVGVTAAVTDASEGTTVPARSVRYRLTGGSEDGDWVDVPYGESPVLFSAMNLESAAYRFELVAVGSGTDTAAYAADFTIDTRHLPVTGGTWRMLSVPLDADTTALGGLLGTGSDAYRWDGNAPSDRFLLRYRRVGGALAGGVGCWIRPGSTRVLALDSAAYRTAAVRVPLAAGWNQVGCPYSYPLRWGALEYDDGTASLPVETAGGPVQPYLWTYADDGYEPATVLEPWQGYFAYAAEPGTLILEPDEPYLAGSASAYAARTAGSAWEVRISATGSAGCDRYNVIGAAAGAGTGDDRYDMLEPEGAPGGGTRLYSVDPATGTKLAADFRADGSGVWYLMLGGVPGSAVSLAWEADGPLPDGLVLTDAGTGDVFALASAAGCDIVLDGTGTRELLVTAGTDAGPAAQLLTGETHIAVMPHPVGARSAVMVRFPHTEYGRQRSRLQVLGTDGREMSVFELGNVLPGIRNIAWQPSLPAGMYILRLSTSSGWVSQISIIKE